MAEMGNQVRDSDSSRDSSRYFWDLRLACNDLRLHLRQKFPKCIPSVSYSSPMCAQHVTQVTELIHELNTCTIAGAHTGPSCTILLLSTAHTHNIFQLIAVETLGPINGSAVSFLSGLGGYSALGALRLCAI